MSRLLRPGRRRPTAAPPAAPPTTTPNTATAGPLPPAVRARVRLSADLLAAVLDVEHRGRATLDDLEWADAVADRILRRQHGRQTAVHGSAEAVAIATRTPRATSPEIIRRYGPARG